MGKDNKTKTIEPSDITKTTDDFQNTGVIRPKTDVPKDSYGNIGIRAAFTNSGLNNSDIGYDGEYVTYKGNRIIKPEYESGGTSYAKQEDINRAINKAYSDMGRELVPIAQYAASYGVPQYAAKYENGNVYLGGRAVPSVYESNGIAYGEYDKVKEVSDWYRNATGSTGYGDMKKEYDNYRDKMNDLIDSYMNMNEWSYNPEKDPAYQAYAEAAVREGQKAYENAIGKMNARTGGYMNSAAATAASQGMNSYLQTIQDKIPEFMKQSYDRYYSDRKADLDDIKAISDINTQQFSDYMDMTESANAFNRQNAIDEFGRKNDEKELWRNSLYTELYGDILGEDIREQRVKSDNQEIENSIDMASIPYAADTAREKYLQEEQKTIGMSRDNEKKNIEISGMALENNSLLTQSIYQSAVNRGYFLPEEAAFLQIDPDTSPEAYYRRQLGLEAMYK